MNLENIISVSGMPGLYRLVSTRPNGLIAEDFDTGRRTFVSIRKHQFTPLESVGIFTITDVEDMVSVMKRILKSHEQGPLPGPNESASVLSTWFRTILPDYDDDRVHVSDIKKLIKWFHFLHERGLLVIEDETEEEE
jgi:hypothetical protein